MKNTKRIVFIALMIALVTLATMVIQVPSPASTGYLNLGDGMIHLASYYFGPLAGVLAGGIGSSLADAIGGYTLYVPFTLVIKGAMGYFVGYSQKKKKGIHSKTILALVLAEILMVLGYYLTKMIMTGTAAIGWATIPADAVQGVFGILIFLILAQALDKLNIRSKIR